MQNKIRPTTQTSIMIMLIILSIFNLGLLLRGMTTAVSADDRQTNSRATAANNVTIPPYFNYQGTLRETDGSLTNGQVDIRAVIYDDPAIGDVLYVEDFPNVNVRDGQFNVVLGENPNGAYNLLTAFETTSLYMGININSTGEIIPRERVHGVPWAINAQNSFDGVPVGGVVDWWRPDDNDTYMPIPAGFQWCNGALVSDPLARFIIALTA